ncbi:unnamed protein product [Trichobilharzia regenti]|nr:unnamed protein product [Trichobilharzia regenti]
MPHPGLKVSTNPKFDGRVKDIDPGFVENLIVLVPHLLAPVNLVVKKINGQEVTCRELFTYFKAYIKIYEGDTLPEPRSMLEATAEANNLNAILTCQEMYTEAMNKVNKSNLYCHMYSTNDVPSTRVLSNSIIGFHWLFNPTSFECYR